MPAIKQLLDMSSAVRARRVIGPRASVTRSGLGGL